MLVSKTKIFSMLEIDSLVKLQSGRYQAVKQCRIVLKWSIIWRLPGFDPLFCNKYLGSDSSLALANAQLFAASFVFQPGRYPAPRTRFTRSTQPPKQAQEINLPDNNYISLPIPTPTSSWNYILSNLI